MLIEQSDDSHEIEMVSQEQLYLFSSFQCGRNFHFWTPNVLLKSSTLRSAEIPQRISHLSIILC